MQAFHNPNIELLASPNPLAAGTGKSLGSAPLDNNFMMLLLAQLKHQNPLEPLNDRDMMAQLTQVSSLQELQKINALLEYMATSNRLSEAAGLIGKTIEYLDEDGKPQTGQVTGVSLTDDQIMVWIGEKRIPLSSVTSVSETKEE
jgi:flagellar basal-body rod modification protein FlgD